MARVHRIKTTLSGRETTCVRLETSFWTVRSLSHIHQTKARRDIETGAGLLSCHVAVCSVFISFKWDKGFKCSKSAPRMWHTGNVRQFASTLIMALRTPHGQSTCSGYGVQIWKNWYILFHLGSCYLVLSTVKCILNLTPRCWGNKTAWSVLHFLVNLRHNFVCYSKSRRIQLLDCDFVRHFQLTGDSILAIII